MPKIYLVNMDFTQFDIEEKMAAEAGIELGFSQERDAKSTIANCQDADGIVTSYGDFDRELFESLPKLKVVSRTGVGYDSIDVPAATDNGVFVCTAPGYANEVVSDHAISMALGVLRRTNELDADIRAGVWDFARRRPLGQCYGRTFGVVGMGAIGRACARKAEGLGFKVVCWSRSLIPGRRTPEGYECLTFDELLETADVISIHTALTPDTHHLFDAQAFAKMKDTAVLVNTSRGSVVDTDALAEVLCRGELWGAGLDVFEGEPADITRPIFAAPHTLFSAHAAYWSEESGVELRTRTMQSAIDAVLGRKPIDCLNPTAWD
ncbi:MAG: C-terminal binding protein [Coriobacteriia bacterium]|nr:C-terminal binding protein [Coriobacteriia bacterium]